MTEQADIEHTIGEAGTYTLVITEDRKRLNVSGFTGGTIRYTSKDDPSVALVTATVTPGSPDNFSVVWTIPTLTALPVGDRLAEDYLAQLELTGSGTRFSRWLTVRIYKKAGDTT